jgi:hypothetical protein
VFPNLPLRTPSFHRIGTENLDLARGDPAIRHPPVWGYTGFSFLDHSMTKPYVIFKSLQLSLSAALFHPGICMLLTLPYHKMRIIAILYLLVSLSSGCGKDNMNISNRP